MKKERHPGMSPVNPQKTVVVRDVPKAQQMEARVAELEYSVELSAKRMKIMQKEIDVVKKELTSVHRMLGGFIDSKPAIVE